jgi:hypothetical protein
MCTRDQLRSDGSSGANSPYMNDGAELSPRNRALLMDAVGQNRLLHFHNDWEREHYIRYCGEQLQEAMVRWERESCFSARGEADFWRIEMEREISRRSPEQVARMEAKQAQRMAREPGAARESV